MPTQLVSNLLEAAVSAAGIDKAEYPHVWAKWVDKVNMENKTGYAFVGDFFDNDPVEIDMDKPRLVIVAASTGTQGYHERTRSANYHYIYELHHVLLFQAPNTFEQTGLVSTDSRKWALQLRDQVNLILGRIHQIYGDSTPLQMAYDHISQRLLSYRLGDALTWDAKDVHAIFVLLEQLERR